MAELAYVKIKSWHVFAGYTRSGAAMTRCGRRVGDLRNPPMVVDELPAAKSCEVCLRIVTRQVDV